MAAQKRKPGQSPDLRASKRFRQSDANVTRTEGNLTILKGLPLSSSTPRRPMPKQMSGPSPLPHIRQAEDDHESDSDLASKLVTTKQATIDSFIERGKQKNVSKQAKGPNKENETKNRRLVTSRTQNQIQPNCSGEESSGNVTSSARLTSPRKTRKASDDKTPTAERSSRRTSGNSWTFTPVGNQYPTDFLTNKQKAIMAPKMNKSKVGPANKSKVNATQNRSKAASKKTNSKGGNAQAVKATKAKEPSKDKRKSMKPRETEVRLAESDSEESRPTDNMSAACDAADFQAEKLTTNKVKPNRAKEKTTGSKRTLQKKHGTTAAILSSDDEEETADDNLSGSDQESSSESSLKTAVSAKGKPGNSKSRAKRSRLVKGEAGKTSSDNDTDSLVRKDAKNKMNKSKKKNLGPAKVTGYQENVIEERKRKSKVRSVQEKQRKETNRPPRSEQSFIQRMQAESDKRYKTVVIPEKIMKKWHPMQTKNLEFVANLLESNLKMVALQCKNQFKKDAEDFLGHYNKMLLQVLNTKRLPVSSVKDYKKIHQDIASILFHKLKRELEISKEEISEQLNDVDDAIDQEKELIDATYEKVKVLLDELNLDEDDEI